MGLEFSGAALFAGFAKGALTRMTNCASRNVLNKFFLLRLRDAFVGALHPRDVLFFFAPLTRSGFYPMLKGRTCPSTQNNPSYCASHPRKVVASEAISRGSPVDPQSGPLLPN